MAGDDHRESAEDTAIWEQRHCFLISAENHPKIRLGDSLRAKVFTPLQKRRRDLGLDAQGSYIEPFYSSDAAEQARRYYETQHKTLIARWVRCHRLTDFDWVYEAASHQISLWAQSPESPAFSSDLGFGGTEFYIEPWFPHESERAYRARMLANCRAKLSEQVQKTKRARRFVLSERGSMMKHFGWVASHLILGWSWSKIELDHTLNDQRVSRQIVSGNTRKPLPTFRQSRCVAHKIEE